MHSGMVQSKKRPIFSHPLILLILKLFFKKACPQHHLLMNLSDCHQTLSTIPKTKNIGHFICLWKRDGLKKGATMVCPQPFLPILLVSHMIKDLPHLWHPRLLHQEKVRSGDLLVRMVFLLFQPLTPLFSIHSHNKRFAKENVLRFLCLNYLKWMVCVPYYIYVFKDRMNYTTLHFSL